MNRIKRAFSSAFKAKVALDLIRESDTISHLCSRYGIHPTQAGKWKSQALSSLPSIFDNKPNDELSQKEELIDNLYKQVGKLQVELEWLKKKTNSS